MGEWIGLIVFLLIINLVIGTGEKKLREAQKPRESEKVVWELPKASDANDTAQESE